MSLARGGPTVAFLQLGDEGSGVRRDGRMLAAALREQSGVEVMEHAADLSQGGVAALRSLGRAVRALRSADVAVIPYGPNRLWAGGRTRLLQLVLAELAMRPTVTVLHDIYPRRPWRSVEWWAMAVASLLSRTIVFHEAHEFDVVRTLPRTAHAIRIPLAIDTIDLVPSRQARTELGIPDEAPIVGMVGWIHPRKNCETAIRTLARLDARVHLWLVGSAAADHHGYLAELGELAQRVGVEDRYHVTGYVTDEQLGLWLAAIAAAIAPYRSMSASASLSTLLGAGRPVAASDLAVTRELHALAPEAIRLSPADDPASFAEALTALLAEPLGPESFAGVLRDRSRTVVTEALERELSRATRRR